jgi:PKD repeat protein
MIRRLLKILSLLPFILFSPSVILALPNFNSISINSDTIGRYEKLELTIDLSAVYINPFDYNQIWLRCYFTPPSGDVEVVDGFYYQDYLLNPPSGALIPNGDPAWKIRFSPTQTGTWTYEIRCTDGNGTTFSSIFSFVCITSNNHGFVRKNNTNFLLFDDGSTFFPVGENLAWSFTTDGFYVYDRWIDSLAANEANLIKIIMTPWSFGIEWNNTGLGNYTNRLDIAFWLDWVLDKATEEDMYMQLCPLIHNEVSTTQNNDWQYSPYNAVNGGPCATTLDFFTNTTAKDYYKRRLRYINSRWGYSSHLLAWELFTETDGNGDFNDHHTDIDNWLIETGQYLNSYDIADHLITTSYAFPEHDPDMWNNPMIDITLIHQYNPTDLELRLHSMTREYLQSYDKPNSIGEFGISHDPDVCIDLDPDGISLHNSLWSTSLSGAFGAGSTWWWDNYIDPQNLYYHFGPVSTFMHSIDLQSVNYHHSSVLCTSDEYLDVVIVPGFQTLFVPAPADYFTVERTGNIIPNANNLSILLYGYLFSSSRNPPHFTVDYAEPGQFSVVTGGTAFLSRIKIWIDDVNVLNSVGHVNTTYTVDVSAGNHIIFVENTGNGYIEVASYIFEQYAPVLRSFALQDSTEITGWMQNRNYNYAYINAYGDPPPVSGGVLNFQDLFESYYSVEWWNCSTGEIDSTSLYAATGGSLSINAPEVLWDAAYKISYVSPSLAAAFSASQMNLCTGDTVHFTDNSTGIITSRLWLFPGGIPSSSTSQNPSVVYSNSGNCTVTLNIYNDFDTAQLVKTNYITVDTVPHLPGTITGATSVCRESGGKIYYVQPVPHATSYVWTLPPGATGSSSTNIIVVSFGSTAQSGYIRVKGISSCGAGPIRSKYITVIPLVEQAGPISGDTAVCAGYANVIYSIAPIPEANYYSWTIPPGASGSSSTNTIHVSYSLTALSGNITVHGNNACGPGPSSSQWINVTPLPAAAGPIYGDSVVCEGYPDMYYYVDPVANATSYRWTLPEGAIGSSTTNEIYITFTIPSVCNFISVKGVNSCGEGSPSFYPVCVAPLPVVSEQPTDTTVYINGDAVFEIPGVVQLFYQWQLSTDNSNSWNNLTDDATYSGTDTPILQISEADPTMNGFLYRCVVSGQCEPPAFSDPAMLSVIPPGWDYTVTSIKHRIIIPLLAHPTINGNPIDVNDYIGVFYEDSTGLKCGGLQLWNGVSSLTVYAYGDDLLTTNKDGFSPNEVFHWKLYSQVLQSSCDATATYLFGPDKFTVNGLSSLLKLEASYYIYHTVTLPAGWSGLSSYVIPDNDSIVNIFDSISGNLVIIMDKSTVYWPDQNINTMVTWNPYSGYKIKVDSATQLTFRGLNTTGSNVYLNAGWNLMPVLSDAAVSTLQTGVLSDLGDTLTIVKEIAGPYVYWPSQNIFNLEYLLPGSAYQIHVTSDCHLSFPASDLGPQPYISNPNPFILSPWNSFNATAASHVIALDKNALSWLSPGDILGVFNADGICSGLVEIDKSEMNLPLVAFGDDPTTKTVTEGFLEGEPFRLMVYHEATAETFEVAANYDMSLPNTGFYATDGLSKIISLSASVTHVGDPNINTFISIYPNPVSQNLIIVIPNIQEETSFRIYDSEGRLIRYQLLQAGQSIIDCSPLSKGIYFIELRNSFLTTYKKIIRK